MLSSAGGDLAGDRRTGWIGEGERGWAARVLATREGGKNRMTDPQAALKFIGARCTCWRNASK